ncbi:MAG: hypothetical protein L3J66_05430 [Bacteroidales bacterium]|nr:hypothetical protein [Bacteroidales bacterium]
MKKTITIVVLLCFATLFAIGQNDYKMMELVYLRPIPGADLDAASKAIAGHNVKYHSEKPFKASMWSTLTGDLQGTWTWVMYPATFTDYDSRPSGEAHDKDWENAIGSAFDIVASEYWREDDKLTYRPENFKSGSKVVFTVFDIEDGDKYRFKAILEKVSEVFKEKKYEQNFSVYWNQFDNKNGRDVAVETMFEKWSFLDDDQKLKEDFDEVHGEGSWWELMEEFQDIVVSADDELSVLMPEMSVK